VRRLAVIAVALSAVAAGPADASVTIGQTQGATDNCGSSLVNVQASTSSGASYVAPSDGVITSWSYLGGMSNPQPAIRLRVYQPGADIAHWIARSESAKKTPGAGAGQVHGNALNTFPESPGIPIKTNDHLGLTTELAPAATGWACISTGNNSDVIRQKTPPDAAIGVSANFPGPNTQVRIGMSAVIEPDADGDNFGDESQDSCTTDPAVHTGACPVDLSIVKTASAKPAVGQNLVYGLSVKNNSTINPAVGTTAIDTLPSGLKFVSSAASQGTCSGTTTVICGLGTLAPGQTATVAIVVKPTSKGVRSNTAGVVTTASDTDSNNNSSTALVTVGPPLPVVTKLKLKPKSFSASAGTQVSYKLNTAAKTTFSVQKPASGIKSGGKCVKPPKSPPAGAKKCTRYVSIGSFKRADSAGAHSFHFNAKAKGKTLKAGPYRLQAVARNKSGAGKPAAVGFKVK
jgi:uncharacterized repeat protein (TIGR01451 family)